MFLTSDLIEFTILCLLYTLGYPFLMSYYSWMLENIINGSNLIAENTLFYNEGFSSIKEGSYMIVEKFFHKNNVRTKHPLILSYLISDFINCSWLPLLIARNIEAIFTDTRLLSSSFSQMSKLIKLD